MTYRHGFTLWEMLACIAAVVLLSGICVMSQEMGFSVKTKAQCKNNMYEIGKALALYTDQNRDKWPWLTSDNRWDASTGEARGSAPSDRTNYNVSALLFMLVREGQKPGLFVCPATADRPDANVKIGKAYAWDFAPYMDGNAEHISYSYQAPIVAEKGTVSGVSERSYSDLVICADRTPAYEGLKPDFNWAKPDEKGDPNTGMSQNHESGRVINLLFADTHVSESFARADCGLNKDNVFSAAGKDKSNRPLKTEQGAGSLRLGDHLSSDDSFLLGPKKMKK